jgi:hypothetical protein
MGQGTRKFGNRFTIALGWILTVQLIRHSPMNIGGAICISTRVFSITATHMNLANASCSMPVISVTIPECQELNPWLD